ncbi:flagellar hook-associated protein FlgK [Desulfarculus baarsii]
MPGIYSMMDISRWALNASVDQLDVVSHNVANVNTPGYSRQVAVLATRNPQYSSKGYFGNGVQTTTVMQYVDKLLLGRLTANTSDTSYYSAKLSQLTRLEALANEASDTGLGAQITSLFNAWQDLSNNPESSAVRASLQETASNMAQRFQSVANDMLSVQRDIDGYLKDAVSQANLICRTIADLNLKIQQSEVSGHSANDYRDERQRQLNELAGLMNISWYEDSTGAVNVQTSSGKSLVQVNYPGDNDPDPLAFEERLGDGYEHNQLVWTSGGLVMDYTEITGGSIGAWLDVRDNQIEDMLDYMNDLAKTIIFDVNKLHASGAGLSAMTSVTGTYQAQSASAALNSADNLAYGDEIVAGSFDIWVYQGGTRIKTTIDVKPTDSLDDIAAAINGVTGLNASVSSLNTLTIHADEGAEFTFANDTSNVLAALGVNTFFDGSTATSISINETIANDVGRICAGRIGDDGELSKGDNTAALDIADLKDSDSMLGDTVTYNESLISWAASLGTTISNATDSYSFATETTSSLENLRDSMSGVSLDEEMVRMIQFQRSYQMAAQMIQVSDELLQTLIGIVK